MSARYTGQATVIPSNEAGSGGVQGDQIGELMPGVLESLQEGPSAVSTTNLYYEEALGSFLAPSFQRQFGIKNETVQNIDGWGQSGTFSIANDIFWNGPAAIQIRVPLKQRWSGTVATGLVANSCFMRPSFFYSHGAGYAAVKEFKMNLGGAGQYSLDRYANFIGVFSSCFSLMQRYTLMKLAGGGVIAQDSIDVAFGVDFSTATYGTIPNLWYEGYQPGAEPAGAYIQGRSLFISPRVRVPVEDNWIVAIKTPHTNYQNPRVRRRPLDTKLFSEHFNVDFWLSNFDEFCDSGVGIFPMAAEEVGGALATIAADTNVFLRKSLINFSTPFCPENHRQYGNIYGAQRPVDPGQVYQKMERYNAVSAEIYNTADQNVSGFQTDPIDSPELLARIGELLSPSTLPTPSIETVISSMRLTNDMLGAYDVLKTRTDQAVYYPFQHFTTQIYSCPNTLYGNMTLEQYIKKNEPSAFPEKETTLNPIRQTIAIPVNPMTAMYVAIAREKDRRGLGVSTLGGYSPALFWNFLRCNYLELSYGSEPLIRYPNVSQYMSEQMYEHCSPIQIPYKGGFCLQHEASVQQRNMVQSAAGSAYQTPSDEGVYHGVLRDSWIYELSLVEMEPLRNESFFQQTPSFQGEQLNLSFKISPSTLSRLGSYNHTDTSYIDSYYGPEGNIENKGLISGQCDITGYNQEKDYSGQSGYPNTLKGGSPSKRAVDVWHMNNDENLMVIVVYAQNALWQLNPNMSKLVFARG